MYSIVLRYYNLMIKNDLFEIVTFTGDYIFISDFVEKKKKQ